MTSQIINKEKSERLQHMTEKLSSTKGLHDKNFWKLKKKTPNSRDNQEYPALNRFNQHCYEPKETKQAFIDHYQEVLQTRLINKHYEGHVELHLICYYRKRIQQHIHHS